MFLIGVIEDDYIRVTRLHSIMREYACAHPGFSYRIDWMATVDQVMFAENAGMQYSLLILDNDLGVAGDVRTILRRDDAVEWLRLFPPRNVLVWSANPVAADALTSAMLDIMPEPGIYRMPYRPDDALAAYVMGAVAGWKEANKQREAAIPPLGDIPRMLGIPTSSS